MDDDHWTSLPDSPLPGYTAHLDQISARARDLPPEERAAVDDAAKRVLEAPTVETVAALWEKLRAAGLDGM
ncbi:hypothetical protein [Kitasatospora sp. NBC_00458]|uniref:hypothetical protein n=1 Tax=Kitasatospora sp. NBC_00458 TaxID=2903568 RepID=UPI002E178D6E